MKPKSIYGRVLLIVIIPILLLQAASVFIYFERSWQEASQKLSEQFTAQLLYFIAQHQRNPTSNADRQLVQDIAQNFHMQVQFLPLSAQETVRKKRSYPFLYHILHQTLRRNMPYPFVISSWYHYQGSNRYVRVRVELPDTYMDVIVPRNQVYALRAYIGVIWIVGLSLGLILLSILFVRNQMMPIQRLARAAEAFGKGRDSPGFKPTGALEIRQAALAFLKMRSRIKQTIEQRTLILAGVSHDLRTALTRLNLHVALLKGVPTQPLMRDIHTMEAILEAYLLFAKSAIDEKMSRVDMLVMLTTLIQSLPQKERITFTTSITQPMWIEVRPIAIQRALGNIIDNALKYGTHAWIELHSKKDVLTITISDNGSGLTPEAFAKALKPFTSGKKGTGLGLTIAHDIIRAHGGDIGLVPNSPNGTTITITLPY